jgi:hypothetical protein
MLPRLPATLCSGHHQLPSSMLDVDGPPRSLQQLHGGNNMIYVAEYEQRSNVQLYAMPNTYTIPSR